MKVCYLFLVLLFGTAYASSHIRGVDPRLSQYYANVGGKFKCLDGSKEIAYERLNDNYCDCPDGSDEPGTSACPKGSFYCVNYGHEPSILSSSFVDDGICDCCDGTDEPPSVCPNSCLNMKKARKQELIMQLREKEKSLAVRETYALDVDKRRRGAETFLKDIDSHIHSQMDLVAELEEAARIAEEEADQRRAEAPAPAAAKPSEGEQGGEETPEQRAERIAMQWEKKKTDDEDVDEEVNKAHERLDEAKKRLDDLERLKAEALALVAHGDKPMDAAAAAHVQAEATPAKPGQAASKAGGDAEGETEEGDEHDAVKDFGPDGVFAYFLGKCFSTSQGSWSYEVCFYGASTQSDRDGGFRVSVGKWHGFEENYTEAVFTQGDYCHAINAHRTMRVKLVCGAENRITHVDEPSTCHYTARMETPAACSDTDAEEIRAAIREIEELEAKFNAEQAAANVPYHHKKGEL